MSRARLQHILHQAETAGLLPAGEIAATPERPWPVVLLTGLGAWLAAIPLLIFVAMLTDIVRDSAGAVAVGSVLAVAAVVVLRLNAVSLFVEQLALPGLLAGFGLIAAGLADGLSEPATAGAMGVLSLCVALAVPQAWLRSLLGAAAAALAAWALSGFHGLGFRRAHAVLQPGLALHLLLAGWLAAVAVQTRGAGGARVAAFVEAVGAGWLAALLAGFAWWSGSTFLLGANAGAEVVFELADALTDAPGAGGGGYVGWAGKALSAGLTLAAALWLARAWPRLRRPWCAGVALVLVGLAAFMPALGGVLLAGAVCLASGRTVLAAAAGVAAAWIVGAFYYQLAWPLATKAGVLAAAAALLGGLAAWGARTSAARSSSARSAAAVQPVRSGKAGWAIALGTAAVLLVAAGAVGQKEQLIAHGRAVFVPLAPVDPRSLMQGDYMALNFLLAGEQPEDGPDAFSFAVPRLVLRLDARGVALARRADDGAPLQADEIAIRLVPRDGRWMLVTDAFHFPEGEAERWAQARFGEFRVDDSGKALLVGLRGKDLAPL